LVKEPRKRCLCYYFQGRGMKYFEDLFLQSK
jgi:hypothetical protein